MYKQWGFKLFSVAELWNNQYQLNILVFTSVTLGDKHKTAVDKKKQVQKDGKNHMWQVIW